MVTIEILSHLEFKTKTRELDLSVLLIDLKTNFEGRGVGGYRPLVYTSGLECLRRKLVGRQSRNVWVKVRH